MPCDAGDKFNSVATKEKLMLGFKFGFQAVVENRQRRGLETQYDPSNELVNKMERLQLLITFPIY
jgi:hypothetical protein